MEDGHHVNWNSAIYGQEAMHILKLQTEIERSLLAAKGLNTNLVHFLNRIMLLLVTCTSALLRVRFPTCTDVHLKRFCVRNILCTKNYDLWRPGWTKSKIRWFYLLWVYSSLMVCIIYVKFQFPCCFFLQRFSNCFISNIKVNT